MAEKFEYTREWTDAEAFPLLGFTKSWENPEDYPTIELDETQVRKDMQSLHDEVKNYINTKLIPAILAEDATEYMPQFMLWARRLSSMLALVTRSYSDSFPPEPAIRPR